MLSTYSKVSFRKFCIDYNVYTIQHIYALCLPLLAFETRSRHWSWENKDPSWLDHHALRWAPALCQGSPGMVWRHFEANTGMEPQNNAKVVKSPLPYCTKLSDEKKCSSTLQIPSKSCTFYKLKNKTSRLICYLDLFLALAIAGMKMPQLEMNFQDSPRPRFHLLGLGHALGKTFNAARWLWNCDSPHLTTHNPSRIHHQ